MKHLKLIIFSLLLSVGTAQAVEQNFAFGEATAAQRQFYLFLVDASDLKTPETGEGGGQTQISYGGAYTNTSGVISHLGNGTYVLTLTTAEIDAAGDGGKFIIRYAEGENAEWQGVGRVSSENLVSTNRALLLRILKMVDETLEEVKALRTEDALAKEIIEE
jgi:hypothetical protein